ncbi:MAG: ribosomal protein S21/MRP21 [Candidatus Pacebacteria bacterium]|nr:ribosomal protein S21/MRP21 [Candidatus Paceibacterota bacterium]
MMIHTEVTRNGNENVGGLMRRFSRKVQSAGVVKRVRGIRYHTRTSSQAKQKKAALTRIQRTEEYVELYKQGREMPNAKKRK